MHYGNNKSHLESTMLWCMAHSCLPTRSCLLGKDLSIDDTRVNCEHLVETHIHTFFSLPNNHEVLGINWTTLSIIYFVLLMTLLVFSLISLTGSWFRNKRWCLWFSGIYGKVEIPSYGKEQTHLADLLYNVLKILSKNGCICKKQGNRVRVHINRHCGKNLRNSWWNVMWIMHSLITTLLQVLASALKTPLGRCC